MKKSLMLLAGLMVAVLATILFTGCQSSLPTATESPSQEGQIFCKQFGRDVDSVRVGVFCSFYVNVAGGTSPTAFRWNFGDGDSLTTGVNQIEHKYVAAGTYTVSVVIVLNDGSISNPITKTLKAYVATEPPAGEILTLISSSHENNGMWTYRLGLAQSAYASGSGANPFITGTGGIIITNPVNQSAYNWVQLVSQVQNGKLVVTVTCYNQDDLFINYGGNFVFNNPSPSWNWANIMSSQYYVPIEGDGGNLRFALRDGQIFTIGGSGNTLPGFNGDNNPAIMRYSVGADSVKFYFNLTAIPGFAGNAFVEYKDAIGGVTHQGLPVSSFFTGWGEIVLPIAVMQTSPVKIRYGHQNDVQADISASEHYDGSNWLEFYLQSVNTAKGRVWRVVKNHSAINF